MAGEVQDTGYDSEGGGLSRFQAMRNALSGKASLAEGKFLALLRYTALLIAGLLLLTAAGLLLFGTFRQIGPTEVEPGSVAVTADDLTPAMPLDAAPSKNVAAAKKQEVDKSIRARTLAVYSTRFRQFQRAGSKITEQQVVDLVWTKDRIATFNDLSGRAVQGKNGDPLSTPTALMRHALDTVDTASQSAAFTRQLTGFRDAKKVKVCRDDVQMRSRTVESWDSYATYCDGWYISPVGCASTRTIDEPEVVEVCEMKFPDDQEAPAEQFASAIDRYAVSATMKLDSEQARAENESAKNHARKLEGMSNIGMSGKLFLGFMAVMFLYLFVAIERHYRALSALVNRAGGQETA